MTKLKTLKDIKYYDPIMGIPHEEERRLIVEDELRQEAIKDINEIKMNHLTKIIKYPTKKSLTDITAFEASGAIAYIMWKNNITEDDLK